QEKQSFNGHEQLVFMLAFSPDGKTLATASWDKTARLWDVATGKERARLTGHANAVRYLAFSPDGKTLAAGGTPAGEAGGAIELWDVAARDRKAVLKGGLRAGITSLSFARDGQ